MTNLIPPSNPEYPWVPENWQMLCYYCAQPIFLVKEKHSALYNQRGNGGYLWLHGDNKWACPEEHIRPDIDHPRCHVCGTQTNVHNPFCSFAGKPPYHATTMSKKEDEVEKWGNYEKDKDLNNALFAARREMIEYGEISEETSKAIINASDWGAIQDTEVISPYKLTEEDHELDKILEERDNYEERLTNLAEAVGDYFNIPVGEWSSCNEPDRVAMEILQGGYMTDRWVAPEKKFTGF